MIIQPDLIHMYMCYRIIFGCVSVRVPEFFEFSHAAQTRGHPYKLYRRHSCNNVRSSYFAVRVIRQQTVWIFSPLWHSNEQSNKLIFRRFYLVSRLRFLDGLLLVPLCGLLIHLHIVSMHSLFWYYCFV